MDPTGNLSLANALACARASQDAYSHATIETALAHCLVIHDETACILAFRGSASLRDWLTDLQAMRTQVSVPSTPDTRPASEEIHHGFWDAASEILPKLMAWWGRPIPPAPMFITGHSLGGALAVLCARGLARAGFPVHSVYTFGGPRVGDAAFAKHYDSQELAAAGMPDATKSSLGARTWRFVDEEDIVPRLPFWHWGYRHVGQECFLPSIGCLTLNPSLAFKLVSDVFGTWLDWRHGRLAQIDDHWMCRYVERVAACGLVESCRANAEKLKS